jgi:hypothetical protein
MSKVSFKYDVKKDAWAWVLIAKDQQDKWGVDWKKKVNFIPQHFLDKILKNDRKKAEILVAKYIASNPKKKIYQLVIKEQLGAVENIWRKIEKEYFKRLVKITQKPIYWNNFTCYLTTGQMCPFNTEQKMFTISKWQPISANITTVCHEIFHLQFLHYYGDYCRKFFSVEQVGALKEIITFILNTDFGDLLSSWDMGYPAHRELREKLKLIWEKDKNFQRFLDKAIKIVKNNESIRRNTKNIS